MKEIDTLLSTIDLIKLRVKNLVLRTIIYSMIEASYLFPHVKEIFVNGFDD